MDDFLNVSELTEEDSGDEQLTAAQVLEKLEEVKLVKKTELKYF